MGFGDFLGGAADFGRGLFGDGNEPAPLHSYPGQGQSWADLRREQELQKEVGPWEQRGQQTAGFLGEALELPGQAVGFAVDNAVNPIMERGVQPILGGLSRTFAPIQEALGGAGEQVRGAMGIPEDEDEEGSVGGRLLGGLAAGYQGGQGVGRSPTPPQPQFQMPQQQMINPYAFHGLQGGAGYGMG
jgi:hypothetical protein